MFRTFLTIAALVALCAPALAETLAVKPGAWEITTTMQMSAATTPHPALDKATPEQRARMEERQKKRAAAGPRQMTTTSCVKKEDLNRDAFGGREQKDCTYKIITQTKSVHAATFECTGAGARSGQMRYEALGGEKMKGMVKMTSGLGGMEMQMEGKWIGPTCKKEDE
jgi:Protein of unknown function (DUF3617)